MNILASAVVRVIEAMFVTGVLGSSMVVLLTSMEDFKMSFAMWSSSHGDRNQDRN